MARENGAHVEYLPDTLMPDNTTGTIVRVWGSEIRALRSAVEAGNRYAFVPYGSTLAEALAAPAKVKPPTGVDVPTRRGPEPRPVKDTPQA